MIARVLVVAGSDSGGGAGIQADIKTVTMLGGHAMTAVTAVTAQNTVAVTQVEPVSTGMVLAQIDAVLADIGADAVKIGMIGSGRDPACAVADRLMGEGLPLVLDPVMVATSGGVLADDDTVGRDGRADAAGNRDHAEPGGACRTRRRGGGAGPWLRAAGQRWA